jgi:hypothetical protein
VGLRDSANRPTRWGDRGAQARRRRRRRRSRNTPPRMCPLATCAWTSSRRATSTSMRQQGQVAAAHEHPDRARQATRSRSAARVPVRSRCRGPGRARGGALDPDIRSPAPAAQVVRGPPLLRPVPNEPTRAQRLGPLPHRVRDRPRARWAWSTRARTPRSSAPSRSRPSS